MKYEIDIEIRKDGTVGFGVKGVKGKKCQEITKFLEETLGEVLDVEYTSEYYQEEDVQERKKEEIHVKTK